MITVGCQVAPPGELPITLSWRDDSRHLSEHSGGRHRACYDERSHYVRRDVSARNVTEGVAPTCNGFYVPAVGVADPLDCATEARYSSRVREFLRSQVNGGLRMLRLSTRP